MDSNYLKTEVIKMTGLSRTAIQKMILNGKIREDEDGRIFEKDVKAILNEREKYIGLLEYAMMHTTNVFNGNVQANRELLLNEVEQKYHDDFNIISWKQRKRQIIGRMVM